MKNPKIVVTDNRREYRRKRAEHLWEGQRWPDNQIQILKGFDNE